MASASGPAGSAPSATRDRRGRAARRSRRGRRAPGGAPGGASTRSRCDIELATSSRTAFGARCRSRSSDSRVTRRSSASSTSTSTSASRVTRNACCSTIFMPGNSRSRCAAITCSIGTNLRPPESLRKRGRSGGTFTRAKRRTALLGSRTTTARFSERSLMYGNGCAGSTASGVRTGKIRSSNTCSELVALGLLEVVPVGDPDAARMEHGLHVVLEDLHLRRDELLRAFPDRVDLLSRAHARPATCPARRRRTCSRRPETRIWKNSSRLRLKMARNRARSSGGRRAVLGAREHARVVVERRELAVEEPRLTAGRRGGVSGLLSGPGLLCASPCLRRAQFLNRPRGLIRAFTRAESASGRGLVLSAELTCCLFARAFEAACPAHTYGRTARRERIHPALPITQVNALSPQRRISGMTAPLAPESPEAASARTTSACDYHLPAHTHPGELAARAMFGARA